MPPKPRLLYVSPVMPAHTGNGLAMRAGIVLEALTHHYDVWLLVVEINPGVDDGLAALARDFAVVSAGPTTMRPAFADVEFDVVHAFRLATVAVADEYEAPIRQLDLDEVDSRASSDIARLRGATGEDSTRDRIQALIAATQERSLASWDRLFVASEVERSRLPDDVRSRTRVLPNAFRAPTTVPCRPREEAVLLFVGTLGYYPNEDAVRWFATEILPLVRRAGQRPVVFHVVGPGARPALVERPGMKLLGAVPDLGGCYAAADIAVVPLRAGAGTRIKALEAFAYGVPVVTTTVGIEGIDARDSEEVWIADTPVAFATAITRLLTDAAVAARTAARAADLWRRRHTVQAVVEVLAPADR